MSQIRIAQPEEKETIQRIYHAVVGSHADQDEARWDRLIQQGGLLVAQAEGRIIGFGGIDVHAAEQVKWLYLLPQHQGAGIGSEILQRLESIGWEAGLEALRVHSAPEAVNFYRRHGYRLLETAALMEHDHEGVEMMKEHRQASDARLAGKPTAEELITTPEAASNSDIVDVLCGIEAQLIAAFVAGDPSVHKRVLSDDWSVIDLQGRVLTKKQVLAESFGSEDRQISSGYIDEIKVRPFGNWAVVTGTTHVTGQYRGGDFALTLRFTDVFAQRDRNWQVIASQATLLQESASG